LQGLKTHTHVDTKWCQQWLPFEKRRGVDRAEGGMAKKKKLLEGVDWQHFADMTFQCVGRDCATRRSAGAAAAPLPRFRIRAVLAILRVLPVRRKRSNIRYWQHCRCRRVYGQLCRSDCWT